MKRVLSLLLLSAGLALPASAQVKAMNLSEMVESADRGVLGQIVSKRVTRLDAPDGRAYYYTTMLVDGRLLAEGTPIQLEVSFPGGFVSEEEGYWHSESPSAEETEVGATVVLFTKWYAGLGGNLSADWLYALHGGLFRTVESPSGAVVLGRGQGYAVAKNMRLADLQQAVARIQQEIQDKKKAR